MWTLSRRVAESKPIAHGSIAPLSLSRTFVASPCAPLFEREMEPEIGQLAPSLLAPRSSHLGASRLACVSALQACSTGSSEAGKHICECCVADVAERRGGRAKRQRSEHQGKSDCRHRDNCMLAHAPCRSHGCSQAVRARCALGNARLRASGDDCAGGPRGPAHAKA